MSERRENVDVVVVGAGVAGLTAALELHRQGLAVTVVEKARGPGGRMSTRRRDASLYDHGAQYFTARHPDFRQQLELWLDRAIVQRWEARIAVLGGRSNRPTDSGTERFVAVPGMSTVCSDMARALPDVRYTWRLTGLDYDKGWRLTASDGQAVCADAVILTCPAEQALDLLQSSEIAMGSALRRSLREVRMLPAWALMVAFEHDPVEAWDAAFVNSGPLSWVARQRSKPQRPDNESWVLHGSPAWSERHLEHSEEEVSERLLHAFNALPEVTPTQTTHTAVHRWRYSQAEQPLHVGSLQAGPGIVLAGDWCMGSRVEGAWLSGHHAARRISTLLAIKQESDIAMSPR